MWKLIYIWQLKLVFLFFFFLGWLVGGKLVTNWFVIWKKWYYHKSCRSKSRPKVFFFSLALFRYLLTKSIVRSRTSFFSVIKLQRINNPFNLAPRLFVTHIHTHTQAYIFFFWTWSYIYNIVSFFLSDYVKSRLTYESKLWDYRLDLSLFLLPCSCTLIKRNTKKGKTNHAIGKKPKSFWKAITNQMYWPSSFVSSSSLRAAS